MHYVKMKNLGFLFKVKELREKFLNEYLNIPPFEEIPFGFRDRKKCIDSFTRRYFNEFDVNFFKEEIKYDEFILEKDNQYIIGNLYDKSSFFYISYYMHEITVALNKVKDNNIKKENLITMKDINPIIYNHDEFMRSKNDLYWDTYNEYIKIHNYPNKNNLLLSIQDSIELINLIKKFYFIISSDIRTYNYYKKNYMLTIENFIVNNFNQYENIKITINLLLIYSLVAVTLSNIFVDKNMYFKIKNNMKKIFELDNISELEITKMKMQNSFDSY